MGKVTVVLFMLLYFAVPSEGQAQHSGLIITNSTAWKPFSYLNNRQQAAGLLVEFWQEFGKVNDLEIQFLLLDWQETLDALRDGKADVHAGLLWSESRDKYLDYSVKLFELTASLFISSKLAGREPGSYLIPGTLIGVVKGGFEAEYIAKHYPQVKTIAYPNNEMMLRAALHGELDTFVADHLVANYYLNIEPDPTQFVAVRTLYSKPILAAVKQGDSALLAEINRGIARIDPEAINRIKQKWIHVETVTPKWIVPSVLASLALISLIYIVHLRRAVSKRTEELLNANQLLQALAHEDSLTELPNRRHFMYYCQAKLDLACKHDAPICVMVIDVDKFKEVNDTFGHKAGDEILKELAQRLSKELDTSDLIARLGGEEFCIVKSNLTENAARRRAEKIRMRVAHSPFITHSGAISVTISVGAKYLSPRIEGASPESLLHQADMLLYQAKEQGRDQVVFSTLAS